MGGLFKVFKGIMVQEPRKFFVILHPFWIEDKSNPLPPPRVAPAVWMRIAWAMFEVEAGIRFEGARGEGQGAREAMKEGFNLAFGHQSFLHQMKEIAEAIELKDE